jgi:hypothetical protein
VAVESKGSPRRRAGHADSICLWCKKPIQDSADWQLHVSLLGAPGAFHSACFEDYQQSAS